MLPALAVPYIESTLRPIAPGASTQWTPVGAPTNWQAVGESGSMDAAFVRINNGVGAGFTDLYACPVPVGGRIARVTVHARARFSLRVLTDPIPKMRLVCVIDGMTLYGPDIDLTDTIVDYQHEFDTVGSGGSVVEIGQQNVNGFGRQDIHKVWADVMQYPQRRRGSIREVW